MSILSSLFFTWMLFPQGAGWSVGIPDVPLGLDFSKDSNLSIFCESTRYIIFTSCLHIICLNRGHDCLSNYSPQQYSFFKKNKYMSSLYLWALSCTSSPRFCQGLVKERQNQLDITLIFATYTCRVTKKRSANLKSGINVQFKEMKTCILEWFFIMPSGRC